MPSVTPSDKPTSSTDAPTVVCLNSDTFRYNGNDKKDCQWIRNEEDRRVKICSKSIEAHDNCPQSCGLCCEDDASYTFETDNSGMQDCDWLSKKTVRQETYCEEWSNGSTVQNACPETCGLCQDYVSVSPSLAP